MPSYTPDYRRLLDESGAVMKGHFVYASGRHGGHYVNKTAALVPHAHAAAFAACIAQHFQERGLNIEAVVGPELGAIAFMADVAHMLERAIGGPLVRVMATKVTATLPPTYEIVRDQARFLKGKRTLIVEDILTTGQSARFVADAVKRAGGVPAAAAALWNRGGVTAGQIGVPELFSVVNEQFPDYPEADCPLCKRNVPVNTELGKGADFLKKKGAALPAA